MSDVFIEPVKSANQRKISEKLSLISNTLADIGNLAFDDPETTWFYRISEDLWDRIQWTAIHFDTNEMFVMAAFRKWAEAADGA